jgi:phage terminase small subunit
MAGVKGKSGGARQGAGRKPKTPGLSMEADPVAFLTAVMMGETMPSPQQLHAATTLAKLKANPVGGKKEQRTEAAAVIATGRFGARPSPLKVVGRIG